MVTVGRITRPHGLKGEVKTLIDDEYKHLIDVWNSVLVGDEDTTLECEIEGIKYLNKFIVFKFKRIDSIDDATNIIGKQIFKNDYEITSETNIPYFHEVKGMDVFDDKGAFVGVIKDRMKTGARDVYVIVNDNKETLIPAVEEFILGVDKNARKVTVKLIEGM